MIEDDYNDDVIILPSEKLTVTEIMDEEIDVNNN